MSFLGRSSLNELKSIWFPKILLDDGQYFHIIFIFWYLKKKKEKTVLCLCRLRKGFWHGMERCTMVDFRKPNLFSFIKRASSEKRHNLSFNIAVYNLPRQLRIVIGRKFFGSSGLPLFLYIWRDALWYKLPLNHINGKMYTIILNMYKGVKSCITYNYCDSIVSI
jgi:hypothetical protein